MRPFNLEGRMASSYTYPSEQWSRDDYYEEYIDDKNDELGSAEAEQAEREAEERGA